MALGVLEDCCVVSLDFSAEILDTYFVEKS